MLTATTLGDQPVDPGLMRDLATLVSGVMQSSYYACSTAGDCRVGGERSAYPDPKAPWWQAIDAAHGRVTHRVGRDDLRPRNFYVTGADRNRDHLVDLVGGLFAERDPQGLVKTRVYSYPEGKPPIVQQWLDAGGKPPPRTSWKAVGLFAVAAAALGGAAAYFIR